jgi:polyhydroxyalkanoate synthesis regulator phasin
LVCVGGLEIFTGEMSKTWQKLWDDMKSRQGPAVAITAPPSPLVPSPPSAPLPKPPSVDEGLPLPGKKFVTQKGTVITLPDTVDKMEDTIKTLGANGTTTILANSLEALIKQLVANNEIDVTQAQDLINLANQGHTIAKMQKLTEAAIAKARTIEEYRAIIQNDSSISVNDINGSVYSHPLGGYAADEKTLDPLQSDTVSWDETGVFLKAYHKAVASGALNDPAVRAFVETLTRKISELSSMSSYYFMALANGEISPSEVNGNIAENIAETHDKSAQICTTGNGQDSGTQCTSGG